MLRPDLTKNILCLGLGFLIVEGFAVGPYALEETYPVWTLPRLPRAFDGMTICHLSDLHIRQWGRREVALAALLEGRSADLVVITGDLACTPTGMEIAADICSRVRSRWGHFAVRGNHEYNAGAEQGLLQQILERRGMTVLSNQHQRIGGSGAEIVLAGTDSLTWKKSDMPRALDGVPLDRFTLLLAHHPDTIVAAAERGIDLQLSGHTHGGQVPIPYLGTPHLPSRYPWKLGSGRFDSRILERVTGKENLRSQMYISRQSHAKSRGWRPPARGHASSSLL